MFPASPKDWVNLKQLQDSGLFQDSELLPRSVLFQVSVNLTVRLQDLDSFPSSESFQGLP
jgi:hypothetical protein